MLSSVSKQRSKMQEQFKLLFTPLKVGPVTIRNRIMSTSHCTQMIDPGPTSGGPGFMGEQYAYYQAEKAKGGVGLIYCGQAGVHPTTMWELLNQMIAYDEKAIPGFRLVTDMIHKHGASTFIQLFHAGAHIHVPDGAMLPAFSPSGVAGRTTPEQPKAMEIEDIDELIEYYSKSAANAKAGGFDGVEIHCASGYLLEQFLSPLSNKRTDEYGGSLDNRIRFLLRVLERVRKTIGNDMALGVRLCCDELVAGGLTPDDAKEIAKKFFGQFKDRVINIEEEYIFKASQFKMDNKKKNFSYADCLGYAIGLIYELKFLTGDKEFEKLENVEFVK